MNKKNPRSDAAQTWDMLAEVYAASRHVSTDQLIEWPAQLAMCGDFQGKRVLDVGCGTGDKTRFFAEHGAHSVVGIDPSRGYANNWSQHADCPNLSFAIGDFQTLPELPLIASQVFDMIVSFQALMYASDLKQAMISMRDLLSPDGNVIISIPHPFRFAILKQELEGWGHGYAYQHTTPYRYPSPWKDDVLLEHAMPRVSDYINAIAAAGLRIESLEEPNVTQTLREVAPEKAIWMDQYVGILIIRAHAEKLFPSA